VLGEINESNPRMLVARGGKGGRGNKHFKNARRRVPTFSERGEITEERGAWLRLELRIVADAAVIGLPNAGKSTLLAASRYIAFIVTMTRSHSCCSISCFSSADPKIADYAFTTVVPNIGIVELREDDGAAGSPLPSRSTSRGVRGAPTFRLSSGRFESTHRFSMLDVPGLLPGAHYGVGLGNAFLRHIQKCR
jgi:GTP-binding protein